MKKAEPFLHSFLHSFGSAQFAVFCARGASGSGRASRGAGGVPQCNKKGATGRRDFLELPVFIHHDKQAQ